MGTNPARQGLAIHRKRVLRGVRVTGAGKRGQIYLVIWKNKSAPFLLFFTAFLLPFYYRLTRINDRDVYTTGDGFLYALDTQHGRLEQVHGKTGKHVSEFYFDLVAVPNSKDTSGGHDLRVK